MEEAARLSPLSGQQDQHTTTTIDSLDHAPRSTPTMGHPSGGADVSALWGEYRSHEEPTTPRKERRNVGNRMYPRRGERALAPVVAPEEVIRRQRVVIAHLRRRITELRESLARMRSVYVEEEMEDLVADLDDMRIDMH
jgi:hypothetical protein